MRTNKREEISMIHPTDHFKVPMPLEELYISKGGEKSSIMYSVAKWSDDDDVYACFIYNHNYSSDKYGEHFGVTHDGKVMMQVSENEGICQVSLIEALIKVSDNPIAAHQELSPTLKQLSDWKDEGMKLYTQSAFNQHEVFWGSAVKPINSDIVFSYSQKASGLRCDIDISVDEDEACFIELKDIYNAINIFELWKTFPHIRVGWEHSFENLELTERGTARIHVWLPLYSDKNKAHEALNSQSSYITDAALKMKSIMVALTERLVDAMWVKPHQ